MFDPTETNKTNTGHIAVTQESHMLLRSFYGCYGDRQDTNYSKHDLRAMVSSHNFKVRVSNHRILADLNLGMPFKGSNL